MIIPEQIKFKKKNKPKPDKERYKQRSNRNILFLEESYFRSR